MVISPGDLETRTAEEVLRRALVADVQRLSDHEAAVRAARDPEAVHQARVATRRLRSQLRTFAPLLRKSVIAPMVAELEWIAAMLGTVRDLDVMAERMVATGGGEDPGVDAARLAPVLEKVAIERSEASAHLVLAMCKKRYHRLVDDLVVLAAVPPLKRAQGRRSALEVLLPGARRRLEEVLTAAGELPVGAPDPALHHVRILAKRARYATEIVAPLASEDVGKLARRLAKLQKTLGELNDAASMVTWLEAAKSGSSPSWLGAAASGPTEDPVAVVEVLLAREHLAMAASRRSWPRKMERVIEAARPLGWSPSRALPTVGASGRRSASASDGVDAGDDLVVEPVEDLDGGHVLRHLLRAAGSGDDR